MSEVDLRYSRHIALPQIGVHGQQLLEQASALIVGLGGLGAAASLYLANSGVGNLVINDFDRVDISNLPRQILFGDSDVGEYKTHATATRLRASNPAPRVTVLNRRLDADELADAVRACDLVLDCSDNFATRIRINAACVANSKPLVSGAAIRFQGQVAVFDNQDRVGPCYRCLYSEDDENLGDCAGQGILAPVAGMVGTVMATETLKLLLKLTSRAINHLWLYDGLNSETRMVAIRKVVECPACSLRQL